MTDLTGCKFHRLTVTGFDRRQGASYFWKCVCDCGETRVVNQSALKGGTTKSCGCLSREQTGIRARKRLTTHGLRGHTLYGTHKRMIKRCYDPRHHAFSHYGGRGIRVCDEWRDQEHGLTNFYEWARQNGWERGLSVDRIDVNGNYEPSNCRWVTMADQQKNKRNVRLIEYNGRVLNIAEWALLVGIPRGTLWERIARRQWTIEKALTTPVRRAAKHE